MSWVSLLHESYLRSFCLHLETFVTRTSKVMKVVHPLYLCFFDTLNSPLLTVMPYLWCAGVFLLWRYIRGSGGGGSSRRPARPRRRWHRNRDRGDELQEGAPGWAFKQYCHLLPQPFTWLQLLHSIRETVKCFSVIHHSSAACSPRPQQWRYFVLSYKVSQLLLSFWFKSFICLEKLWLKQTFVECEYKCCWTSKYTLF